MMKLVRSPSVCKCASLGSFARVAKLFFPHSQPTFLPPQLIRETFFSVSFDQRIDSIGLIGRIDNCPRAESGESLNFNSLTFFLGGGGAELTTVQLRAERL